MPGLVRQCTRTEAASSQRIERECDSLTEKPVSQSQPAAIGVQSRCKSLSRVAWSRWTRLLKGKGGKLMAWHLASSRLQMQTAASPAFKQKRSVSRLSLPRPLPSFRRLRSRLTQWLAARYSLPSSRCATEAFLPGERCWRWDGNRWAPPVFGWRLPSTDRARVVEHGAARAGTKRAVGPGTARA